MKSCCRSFSEADIQPVATLAQGLWDALPVLIAALLDIIAAIVDFIIDSISQIIDAGIDLLIEEFAANHLTRSFRKIPTHICCSIVTVDSSIRTRAFGQNGRLQR